MEKTKENINLTIPPADEEKLNPEVKADWLGALRSGNYKQTSGRLCKRLNSSALDPSVLREYGYCCMGVLADRYRLITGNGVWVNSGGYVFHVWVNSGGYVFQGKNYSIGNDVQGRNGDADIPVEVQQWSGLVSERIRGHLAQLNDGVRLNFIEIADWIDENL